MKANPQLIQTKDGSHTLYLPGIDEQYHSLNGAITESLHIYINNGYLYQQGEGKNVFEVGFGTGLNCLLTALESEKQNTPTTYTAIEKYPLPNELARQLNYPELLDKEAVGLFKKIHQANWGKPVMITGTFSLHKIQLDIITQPLPGVLPADVIYFDAFGPGKQPEIWGLPVFEKVSAIAKKNAVFVTYSVKGTVKRRLISVGFQIEKLPGPPGKKEILRGIKAG
ncbi:putative peptidase [hydrothermal vent metagenome]|uniref:Putative peptidase n=1 Tax=hydrothermal vent metagenome TaxID=652676 RepID=A0A3B0U497_9ZZZZ